MLLLPSLFANRPALQLKIFAILLPASLLLAACANSSAATQATPTQPAAAATLPAAQATPVNTPLPPTPTTTPTLTATPSPTLTPSPSPTPTPALRQLTTGGCCVQPSFSPDGQRVLFIDKPGPDAPTGIYGVNIADPQATPQLVNQTIGFRNPDRSVVATMDGNLARFVNESTGQSWAVDTGGNWPRYSPNGRYILWEARDQEGPYDRRKSDIWLAELDGSNSRLLLTVTGGGFVEWLPNSNRILLVDRQNPDKEERTLLAYNWDTDQRVNLVTEKRLRGVEVSPGGSWIAYFLTFADDPQKDGIWVASSNGETRYKLNTPGFGAYRWRNDTTLFYIPMRPSAAESMQLWAVDVLANQSSPLTNPASLSFSISNGDWEAAPDGRHIIFVNSADQNIWLITLP